ncbi:MAG: hypothetical protein IRZ33_06570 [Alicyclobacillaceae bacterium]|nr:hypothetical protein [Alicyclobacillaceae bacterium]
MAQDAKRVAVHPPVLLSVQVGMPAWMGEYGEETSRTRRPAAEAWPAGPDRAGMAAGGTGSRWYSGIVKRPLEGPVA